MQVALPIDMMLLVAAGLALLAIFVSALITRRFQVPGAILFLTIGMVVGDDGLNLISLADAELVRTIGVVALLFILLEGGLTTKPTDLRLAAVPGILLATLGVVLTATVTTFGVWLLLDVDLITAAIIGAVISSTDAAAVFSMMRTAALPRRTAALLRVESGSNDPIAVVLTVGLITTFERGASAGEWAWFALLQMVGGTAIGALVGALGVLALRRLRLTIEGFYPLAVAAFGILAYGIAVQIGASGFVAVYVAGLILGALLPRHRRVILDFHEAIGNASEIGLFLILGLLVFPSRLPAVALSALLVALILMFVARPLAVWVCTIGQRFSWRERTVVTVGGLKGAVPIVLATFPLTAGVPGADIIFDVVFFVVLVSLLVQGLALMPTVRALRFVTTGPAWAPVAETIPLYGIEIDLIELHVTADMPIVGRPLFELRMPAGSIVTAIVRDDEVVIPKGDTAPQVDDVLLITTKRGGDAMRSCTEWARGER
jgi:cell volume regulation protein A